MDSKEYLIDSARTTAPTTEEDRNIPVESLIILGRLFDSGNECDIQKRVMFYKDTNVGGRVVKNETLYNELLTKLYDLKEQDSKINLTEKQMEILHGLLGVFSEAGEMVQEFLNSVLENRDLDDVNFEEEVGDILWYQAVILRAIGGTFDGAMEKNIKKLQKRYPNKFTLDDALNRDLVAEREILEGTINTEKDQ